MIIVKFTSGLGNQMFQYNIYDYLRKKYPDVPVKADITWFGRSAEHQGFELIRLFKRADNPDFVFDIAGPLDILRCTGRIPNVLSGKVGDIWQSILKVPHNIIRLTSGSKYIDKAIEQSGFEDNREVYNKLMSIDPRKDYYISGFYIEEIYYRERLSELRNLLVFDNNYNAENADIVEKIRNTYSVSLHVRRGDYLSPKYNSSFIALPMEYYREAVDRIIAQHPEAKFFVFSDDKDYIEKEFLWLNNKELVMINSGQDSFRDMQLMSLCKSNIIANSTFSVWAGLLNNNPEATVIYPSIYMHEKDSEVKSIPGWVRI